MPKVEFEVTELQLRSISLQQSDPVSWIQGIFTGHAEVYMMSLRGSSHWKVANVALIRAGNDDPTEEEILTYILDEGMVGSTTATVNTAERDKAEKESREAINRAQKAVEESANGRSGNSGNPRGSDKKTGE